MLTGAYDLVLITDYVPVGGRDFNYQSGIPAGQQFYEKYESQIPKVKFLTFNKIYGDGKVDMWSISDISDFLEFIRLELENATV